MSQKNWNFSREDVSSINKNNPFKRKDTSRKAAANKPAAPIVTLKSDKTVFISYARDDLPQVQQLVRRLKDLGINVVWDQDFLAGVDFEDQIRSMIEHAAVVLVIWSSASKRSDFVRDEARLAKRDGKLLPVIADDLDVTGIPLGFGGRQTISASDIDATLRGLAAHDVIATAPPPTI